MSKTTFSFQRLAHVLIILFLFVYLIIISKVLLVPLVFAAFGAIMLNPICDYLERYIPWPILAILLTLLIVLIPLLGAISFFVLQFVDVFQEISSVTSTLMSGVNQIIQWLSQSLKIDAQEGKQWIMDNFSTIIDTPISILGNSLTSSTTILAGLFLMFIFVFLILLYRKPFSSFLLMQFRPSSREEAREILSGIQRITRKYLYGLLLVIIILGILNSVGLWVIGIDYPFFWGYLAAFLAIIPYIGTTLGGAFPFLYALATTGTVWQPLAVVILYFSIQNLEGNLITPKVVGSSVKLNPLAAIISLILGGMIWGIAGLILALPVMAILRVIFQHIEPLMPVGELLSNRLYESKDLFREKYDEERYRLINYFRKD